MGYQVRSERGKWLTDPCSSGPVVGASVSGARLAHYLRRRPSLRRFQSVHAPQEEAALLAEENLDEVYPRLALLRKNPTGPPADDSDDGSAHEVEQNPAGEGENDGLKVKMLERVESPWWAYGSVSSERGRENAPYVSEAG
jgi:hypothetical protein